MIGHGSSKKEVIALAGVALVILALVGFVSFGEDADLEIEDVPQVIVPEDEVAVIPERVRNQEEKRRREAKGLPTGSSKKVDARSHLHGGYGTTFRVVDSETRRGVAHAVVYFLPQKSASEMDWKWRREDVIRRLGQRLKADSWGDVRVKSFIGSGMVMCAHKGRYGELYMKSFYDVLNNKHELILEPDPAVRIKVVDAQGSPAKGVPVALWRDNEEAHRETDGKAPRRILIWTGSTQSNGFAFARRSLAEKSSEHAGDDGWNGPLATHLAAGRVQASFYFPPLIPQTLFEELSEARNRDTLNEASGITRALIEQVVDVSMTSEGPRCPDLELPGTGAVKLVLHHDDGSMYEEPCVVWVGRYAGERNKGPATHLRTMDFDPKLGAASSGALPFMSKKGIVTLSHVGLFSDFDITVMPMDMSHDAVTMRIIGPTRSRQIQTVNVPLGPDRPILSGKLRDANGDILANEPIDVALAIPAVMNGQAATKHHRAKTDKEGKFEVRVPTEFTLYESFELRIRGLRKMTAKTPPFASVVVKSPEANTDIDVGELTLTSRGLICRGRILDQKNRAVPDVRLYVLRNPFPGSNSRQSGDQRVVAATQPIDGPEIFAEFLSNKQGYFALGGYVHSGTWEMLVVQGTGDQEIRTRFEFTPGKKDMVIRVETPN